MRTHPANPMPSARLQPSPDLLALSELAQDVDCSPREWLSVVNRLPALQQCILEAINSSRASVPQPITSIPQAIVSLGFNTVRNLACRMTH